MYGTKRKVFGMPWSVDQTCLYEYDIGLLPMISESGVLSTSKPSPLTRDEIVPVLKKIAKHSSYQKQTIVCHDENFDPIVLQDGKVMNDDD